VIVPKAFCSRSCPAFKASFWQADVMKMVQVYGAPTDDDDVGKIIEYLSENY
jgi:hypothetical protein